MLLSQLNHVISHYTVYAQSPLNNGDSGNNHKYLDLSVTYMHIHIHRYTCSLSPSMIASDSRYM